MAHVVLILICLCLGPAAKAALLAYEGFDYPPNGTLDGNGYASFTWETNVWIKSLSLGSDWWVFTNSLSHPSVEPTGGHVAETNLSSGADYERKLGPREFQNGDIIWFSFLVKVTQQATWNLLLTSGGSISNEFGVSGNFPGYTIAARMGVGYNGSAETIDLGSNVTRFVVARYRYSISDIEQLDVWVDPDTASEPLSGGLSTSNHIVHQRQQDLQPAGIDRVWLQHRSLGSLAFDELRVGTTWKDVVPLANVHMDGIKVAEGLVALELCRLTPGATNTLEWAPQLPGAASWTNVNTFVALTESTNMILPATNLSGFFRIRTR